MEIVEREYIDNFLMFFFFIEILINFFFFKCLNLEDLLFIKLGVDGKGRCVGVFFVVFIFVCFFSLVLRLYFNEVLGF